MAPYKINRNKKPLTDEQIERHKSFSSLLKTQQELHQYKSLRKPLYKNFKVLSVIVVALTVVLVMVLEYADQNDPNLPPTNDSIPAKTYPSTPDAVPGTDSTSRDTGSVKPESSALRNTGTAVAIPASLQLSFTAYKVNAEKGAVLYPGNGNRILIPANAFKDAQGNVIKGNVEIRYREFRNSFDFFRRGIPMHWKNGQCLISNGMFEILGTQNGKVVSIAQAITVDLLTVKQEEEYKLYYFDETKQEWLEKGKENKRETFFTSAPSTSPKSSINKAGHPMSVFSELTWELITPMDPQKLMSVFRTPWSNVFITKMEGDAFTLDLTLNEGSKSQKVTVQATLFPIYTQPAEHSAWLKELYKGYQAAQKKLLLEQQTSDQVYQKYINSEEYRKYQAWIASPEGQKVQLSGMVYSRFTVNNFGVWNCDRPANLPRGTSLDARFADEHNKPLSKSTIYLVDYDMNSIFNYYPGAYNKFLFNPAHRNILWCVLDENHIGIFKSESFKNVPGTGPYTFIMRSVDIKGMQEADFNKLFSLPAHVTTKQQIEVQNKVNVPERTIRIIDASENSSDIVTPQ